MLGEVVAVNGVWILDCGREYGDLDSSTYGWTRALQQACDKLDLGWIMDYYNSLEWYDSDIFDGEIESRCCELITRRDEEKVQKAHTAYFEVLDKWFEEQDTKGQFGGE